MTFEVTAETTKLIGGAGGIFEVKMGWAELVLARLMEGNWKPGCQVMTAAGSPSLFQRSSCDLRVRKRIVRMTLLVTMKKHFEPGG